MKVTLITGKVRFLADVYFTPRGVVLITSGCARYVLDVETGRLVADHGKTIDARIAPSALRRIRRLIAPVQSEPTL